MLLHVVSVDVERAAENRASLTGGVDDRILLRVHGIAELVTLAMRHAEVLPLAGAAVAAVLGTSRSAIVPGRYDDVVLHDDGSVVPAEAGRALRDALCDIEIVFILCQSC